MNGSNRSSDESTLLLGVRDFLTTHEVPYVLARNYEGYPDRLTGDVDLYVDLGQLNTRLESLRRVVQTLGWVVVREVHRPWVLVLQAVKVQADGERGILVFEFFDRFQWLGFEYFPFDQIAQSAVVHNGFRVLPPEIGFAVTICHYFFWVGFLPSKYQRRIAQCVASHMWRDLTATHLGLLATRLNSHTAQYTTLRDGQWITRPGTPEPLFVYPKPFWIRARVFLIARALWRTPIRAFRSMLGILREVCADVLRPGGRILVVELKRDDAQQLLFQFKKYHLYNNSRSRVVTVASSRDLVRSLLAAFLASIRGGVCIVNLTCKKPLVRALVLRSMGHVRPEIDTLSEEPLHFLRRIAKSS